MGHSQADKAASRERILDAAARQIREKGLDSLSIAELMKQAQLTHGAFYGHFPSRAALIQAAVERAVDDGTASFVAARPKAAAAADAGAPPSGRNPVKTVLNSYLSAANRDQRANSCAFASLAADVGRSDDPAVRQLMAGRMEQAFAGMSRAMGGGAEADAAALAAWSTMIGAVTLARLFDGPRSDEILKAARQSILELAARVETASANA